MPHCVAARARIHYEVDGEGEPLVLIAGTAFDLSFWDDLLSELRGFRVLRLDNRGAGLSDALMRLSVSSRWRTDAGFAATQ